MPVSRQRVNPETPSTPGATGRRYGGVDSQERQRQRRLPGERHQVVERARALAADPSYPSVEIARRIAEQIIGAPDLSEVE